MTVNLSELNLKKIGLTKYEINTINAMLKLKESTPPNISRVAGIPKTRIYDVLEKLEEEGFVMQVSDSPKIFRLHKIKEALQKRTDERKNELQEIDGLLKQFSDPDLEEEAEQLIKLKTERDMERVILQELGKAKEGVVAFTNLKPGNKKIISILKELSQKKDVKVINANNEMHGLNAVHKPHDLHAYIIDDSRLLMGLNKEPNYNLAVLNNKHMINALKSYFEQNWKK